MFNFLNRKKVVQQEETKELQIEVPEERKKTIIHNIETKDIDEEL